MPDTFTIHEAGSGVWAAVAPSMASPAVSNAAIVDLGDKTLVVDTFMTVGAARELDAEARRLTGRPATFVMNTHWHSDHVRGNRVFADTPIIGTERMNELIVADAPTAEAHVARIAELREVADSIRSSGGDAEMADGTVALADALEAEDDVTPVLPDLLVEHRMVIEGERAAVIQGLGPAHTESDLFVHLPDVSVLVAGDLVWNGVHPKTVDGFPTQWASVLDALADLGPNVVVTGHGPNGTLADIKAMAAYIREVAAMVEAVKNGDLDPAEAPAPSGTEDWFGINRLRTGLEVLAGA